MVSEARFVRKPLVVGIAGGTGSGKSTVARSILESIPEKNVAIIEQDCYYKDQSHLMQEERVNVNYDHPLAFDTELLIEHVEKLIQGQAIEKPLYDFTVHNRREQTLTVLPREIILLEGILILDSPKLRNLMDIKIFVDTDADVRIIRRIVRDMRERGRSLESIISQYQNIVKPAHNEFCEPTKRYADLIIPEGGYNKVAVDIMVTKVKSIIGLMNS